MGLLSQSYFFSSLRSDAPEVLESWPFSLGHDPDAFSRCAHTIFHAGFRFMFQLTSQQKAEVVANCDHLMRLKFSPAKPFVFTEHGAVMVASVLNSEQTVTVSVYVVRAFVKLRELSGTHKKLAQKLAQLERRVKSHDDHIHSLFEAIRQLMEPPVSRTRRIGFKTCESER